jgi:hypothetical protein
MSYMLDTENIKIRHEILKSLYRNHYKISEAPVKSDIQSECGKYSIVRKTNGLVTEGGTGSAGAFSVFVAI